MSIKMYSDAWVAEAVESTMQDMMAAARPSFDAFDDESDWRAGMLDLEAEEAEYAAALAAKGGAK